MTSRCRFVALAASAALLLAAPPSGASPETLRQGFGDLVQGPLDAALSPVTAGVATARNLPEVGDGWGERAVYPVLGYGGLLIYGLLSGAGRCAYGALETAVGVLLFPFPGVDLGPETRLFARDWALVDLRNPLAQRPPWLKWVPPLTLLTIDARFGALPPGATYGPMPQEE